MTRRIILLLVIFLLVLPRAGCEMHDVLEPYRLPPHECPHGCAAWADLAASGNRAPQGVVDALWAQGAAPAGAGRACAQPGRAINSSGLSTFTALEYCQPGREQRPPDTMPGAPPEPLGNGSCVTAGFSGAFCLCAGAERFVPTAGGEGAGWGYCRSQAHTPEQINLQLAQSGDTLVVGFVTFPSNDSGVVLPSAEAEPFAGLGPPEAQIWPASEPTAPRRLLQGVSRGWQTPRIDYALSYHKPKYNASGPPLLQPVRAYALHFVKLDRLSPGRRYAYRVRCTGGWSQTFEFTSPPAAGRPTRVALFGDMGVFRTNNMGNLRRGAEAGAFDAIAHIGDHSCKRVHSTRLMARPLTLAAPPRRQTISARTTTGEATAT